jgi:hypothetical protein
VTTASATALAARPSSAAEALEAAHWTTGPTWDLSRHWRHASSQARRDPIFRKYHRAGKHLLNSVAAPNHGQI